MAQIVRVFDNDTVGASPAGMTVKSGVLSTWLVQSGSGEKHLQHTTTTTGIRLLALDAAGTTKDAEIVTQFHFDTLPGFGEDAGVYLRGSGSTNFYRIMPNPSFGQLIINQMVSGTNTNKGAFDFPFGAMTTGTKYRLRAAVSGTNVVAKLYLATDLVEPDWQLSVTVTDLAAASLGLYSNAKTTVNFDFIGVGLGEPAPLPGQGSGRTRSPRLRMMGLVA